MAMNSFLGFSKISSTVKGLQSYYDVILVPLTFVLITRFPGYLPLVIEPQPLVERFVVSVVILYRYLVLA
jgi:hypothetical protein